MTAFQEPLEKGWLRTALREVREEVDGWTNAQQFRTAAPENAVETCQDIRKIQEPR